MNFPLCLQVKQFVGEIRRERGGFRVMETGDPRYFLFAAIDRRGAETGLQFPVEKTRLRRDVRRIMRGA